MDERLKACKNCRWFGPIDSYFLTYGMCRKHMKTVHMSFVCDDWEPLWSRKPEEKEDANESPQQL